MILRDPLWLFWEWSEDALLVERFIRLATDQQLRVRVFSPTEFCSLSPPCLPLQFPGLLWDRAGDVFAEAQRLSEWAETLGSRVINPVRGMLLAKHKGLLHRLLQRHDLPVPATRFLTDASPREELGWGEGRFLVLKPDRSGGGEGVRMQEWTESSLVGAMLSRPGEVWLLQEHLEPALIGGRRAWFRVFYLFGEVQVCWWDNQTHVYEWWPREEAASCGFSELYTLGQRIGRIVPLHFFSTEIAYRQNGHPVIVDYINDPCDLRSQDQIPDGVPEQLLGWILSRIFAQARDLAEQRS